MRFLYLAFISLILPVIYSCNMQPESSNVKALDSTAGSTTNTTEVIKVADDSLALRIGEVLRNKLVKDDVKLLSENDRHFIYSSQDLDNDGEAELFVAMKGSYFCGTGGCTVFLLNGKFEKITTFTVVAGPIQIANSRTRGWSDLIIPTKGQNYLVQFNGRKYPGNPSVQLRLSGEQQSVRDSVLGIGERVHTF